MNRIHVSGIRLLAILPVITLNVSAQKHKADTVVLKDGSILTGTIIADSADFLELKVKRPRVIILSKSQISSNVEPRKVSKPGKHGYYLQSSASFLAGKNSSGDAWNMSVQLLNAYQFRNGLSIGIGTGVERFDLSLVPVYADLRLHPFSTRVSPFIWLSSGYGFPCSGRSDGNNYLYDYYNDTRGGILFNTGSGITINSWNRCAVSMGIGYRHQRIISEANNLVGGELKRELVTDFNRIEILFGILFR